MNVAIFNVGQHKAMCQEQTTQAIPSDAGRITASYLLICPSGVLYDDTLWWRWLLQMLTRFGMHTDAGAFTSLWQRDYYDDVCSGQREFFDALRKFLTTCGMHAGQIDELYAAGRLHWKRLELDLRSFPQTSGALASMASSGFRMGLLVNGPLPKHETRAQLERMDVLRHFEHIVYSGELSSSLTNVNVWPSVLQQIGVVADSLAFVAHDDWLLRPAKENGVTTIAYQRPTARADFQVGQLADLAMLASSRPQLQAA